ncbi:D-amino-acid dehydrogenase (plasmid) [Ensifer sp. WSM1721]|uniref:NAD(P)/FAD-dependent oxidoreductase n=1 Tax=Ensifer sp. WSM1721 TaxID=1041159 RepID=UPI00047D06EA|nr:FAD-binding oxidoreductase [Ensifer sp. WSM1721]
MNGDVGRHAVVIGCGIVGACIAHALLNEGWQVRLIEPGPPGGEQAASFGNGAFISPASVVPISTPGLWKKIPTYLLSSTSPLTIRWRYLPRLFPWLCRFMLAGWTVPKVEQTARALGSLLQDCADRHRILSKQCGCDHFIRQDGLLYVYPSRAEFELDALAWRLRRENGVVWRELEDDDLHRFEPALNRRYQFAALVEKGGNCTDPGRYVSALVCSALTRGATLIDARATGFVFSEGMRVSVQTDRGGVQCDKAVIAAGIFSKPLAAQAGDIIPLESERGYHVEIAAPASTPHIPVLPSDGKVANTPIAGRLRASGQVELASLHAPPNWKRADILLKQLLVTFPELSKNQRDLAITRWQGHRPSTPDSLPVIDVSSSCRSIVYAFGHGHVGLASAPRTAELVAALVADREPSIDRNPFRATRFRWRKAS